MAAQGATLAHSCSAYLGDEMPSKVEITPLDLPHKEIMRDFYQFCQVVILYTVFLKSVNKVIS